MMVTSGKFPQGNLSRFTSICCTLLLLSNAFDYTWGLELEKEDGKPRVAIIGGGVGKERDFDLGYRSFFFLIYSFVLNFIGGTFAANFLSKFNSDSCGLGSVVIFDPHPIGIDNIINKNTDKNWQGSRVSSVTLSDGTIVEVGASIAFTGNRYLREMAEADPKIKIVPPFYNPDVKKSTEKSGEERTLPDGFGVWNGAQSLIPEFIVNTFESSSWSTKMRLLYRYNFDLLRLTNIVNKALKSFDLIYEYLESNEPQTFFDSSKDMWKAVGFQDFIKISFDEFLDKMNISSQKTLALWRRILPHQGNLRDELLTAVNLCNYNQENSNLNGLVGLISFVPTKGQLFSIAGGNNKLIKSAFQQAQLTFSQTCQDDKNKNQSNDQNILQHVQKQITTVISDTEKFELWSGQELMGNFDVIILAAPIQQCQISFLILSHHDSSLLQEMPLNGMIDADIFDANEHNHRLPPIAKSATLKYTQVITTVLSNATINYSHFRTEKESFPRSIYLTKEGKEKENFQSITQITADGVYKMFSSEKLTTQTLDQIFEEGYIVEYEKEWGGKYGGATPNFGGGGDASEPMPYLLYDGGVGFKGLSEGPGLYYVNSIEAAAASMEISAIGAKSVAKLVAKRLKLLAPSDDSFASEL